MIAFKSFCGVGVFVNCARNAFSKGCKWFELDVENLPEAMCYFHMCLADDETGIKHWMKNSTACHPQFWWFVDGID